MPIFFWYTSAYMLILPPQRKKESGKIKIFHPLWNVAKKRIYKTLDPLRAKRRHKKYCRIHNLNCKCEIFWKPRLRNMQLVISYAFS